jgi:hypothetical protein
VDDALRNSDWVLAMQEELNNFTRNDVWHLVPRPNQNVIGTKWVFRNKQDEHDVVIRNKARLVAKGYSQVEGLDLSETYAPVARLESICILLAYATYHGFNKFGMKDVKPIKTHMGTNGHVDLDTGGKSVDQKVYRSMIGSLLYLCASRPDSMLSVCMCARFQADPKEVHLRAMKRIMRYLVYTPKFGFWYPKGSTFDLIGYSDADWAGCKIDRKSTSGTCQFLGRSLVSWFQRNKTSSSFYRRSRVYCRRSLLRNCFG